MNSFLKYNALPFFWAFLILVLCLLPGKDLPGFTIFEFDKFLHFGIYLILALLMYYGWKKQISFSSLHHYTVLKILVITFSYGFLVEILQEQLTADRHFDVMDALANSAGAVAGSFLSPFVKRKLTL